VKKSANTAKGRRIESWSQIGSKEQRCNGKRTLTLTGKGPDAYGPFGSGTGRIEKGKRSSETAKVKKEGTKSKGHSGRSGIPLKKPRGRKKRREETRVRPSPCQKLDQKKTKAIAARKKESSEAKPDVDQQRKAATET